ncbi:unnamed protein product [Miscanthus lutarioriparius]|uniref:Uncharacterized protein n=1 Tax=Miscanthus lutarioriparius TaxID=422564 RepID=A0A811PAX0_9POAL|nr:unnamed protein product [Miscanthus lutarioriparius]
MATPRNATPPRMIGSGMDRVSGAYVGSVRDVVRCGSREVDDDKRKRAATRSTILGGAAARGAAAEIKGWGYRFLQKLGPILRRTELIVPRSKDAL